MTIHIDPNADIIQQLNDLHLMLAVKEVNVVVSQEQLKAVKEHIAGVCTTDKGIADGAFIVRIGAVEFNLTAPQQFNGEGISL